MTNIRNALMQAAGSAGGTEGYVEDFFSTFLYTGNATSRTIVNGINLDASSADSDGGLVWIKNRDVSGGWGVNFLWNTESSPSNSDNMKYLQSESTTSEGGSNSDTTKDFGGWASNGFLLGAPFSLGADAVNGSGSDYVSWTFRKQEGFFDIVTYTGDTSSSKQIAHNLGSTPACILIKRTDDSVSWLVYHKDIPGSNGTGVGYMSLNTNDNNSVNANAFPTQPTSTHFTVNANYGGMNASGASYIAYLFAGGNDSASQIFGDDGDEAIIKCGGYTADSSNAYAVNLGFEPQWLMIKRTSGDGDWEILDNMRGVTTNAADGQFLEANNSNAEFNDYGAYITSTGFVGSNQSGANGASYIYVAIRRGPMKEPSVGTDVYKGVTGTNSAPAFVTGMPVDWAIRVKPTSPNTTSFQTTTRLTNPKNLNINDNSASFSSDGGFDFQNGFLDSTYFDNTWFAWNFRRFPKVFDVVVYTGTGSSLNVTHNLNATPELIIIKKTTESSYAGWAVYYGTSSNLILNKDNSTGHWYSNAVTAASSTTFTAAANTDVNDSTETHIALLFASLDGISKVGTYSGTGNDVNVTGLGAAARFVMIKRTDNTGDWYVYDSTRGIVSGNDPYLLWNSTAAEVTNTDYIDPHSSGFTITSSAPDALNASGGTYLYLAFS